MFDSAIREAQGLISDQQAAIAQHGLRETLLKVLKPTPEIQRQLAEASAAKAEAAAEITRLRQELDEVFAHRDSVLPGLTGDLARRKEEKLINYPMGAITAAGGVAAGASGTENPTLKSASLASTLSSMADTAIGSALVGGGGSALLAEPGHRRDAAVRGALMGGSTGALLGIATPPGLSGLIENSMIGGTLGTMGSYLTEPVKGSSGAAQRADETSNDEAVARRMGYNNYDEYYNNFMQSSMENPLDFNVTHPNGTVDVYRDGSLQVGKTASLSRNSPATLAGVLRSLGGTWHK
jgi:hypothetical protein